MKLNSFSIIFSFKLIKICDNNEDIFLLNIENYNNEWNTNINLNKDIYYVLVKNQKLLIKK